MASDITVRFGAEGEKAFRQALAEVNQQMRTLDAASKATISTFNNSDKSLNSLNKASAELQKQLIKSKSTMDNAKSAVADLTEKFGENDAKTLKMAEAAAKAETQYNNLTNEAEKLRQGYTDAASGADKAADSTGKAGKAAKDAASDFDASTVAIGNLLAKVAEWGAEALKRIGETGIKYNAQMETYAAALSTAMDDSAAASAALEQIKNDALTTATTFSVDSLVQANRLLISAGISADDSRKTILALTDAIAASGGGNDELNRMAYNLQQIANNGKATSVDIKQFGNAGIAVYQILADYTGKSIDQVKELDVTYETLSGALQKAASEGGRYFQANATQAATLNGEFSQLKNTITAGLGDAFSGVSDALRDQLLPDLIEITSAVDFRSLADGVEAVAVGIGTAAIAAKGYAAVQAALASGLTASAGAQEILNAAITAAPYAAIGAGVAVGIGAIKNFNRGVEEHSQGLEKEISSTQSAAEALEVYNKAKEKLAYYDQISKSGNFMQLTGAERQEYSALVDTIHDLEQAYLDKLAAEKAAAEYEASDDAAFAAKAEETIAETQKLIESYDAAYEAALKSISGQVELFGTFKDTVYTSTEDMIAALENQVSYMRTYADNLGTLADIGINQGLIAALSDGSEKSAGYVQSIIDDYKRAEAETSGGGAALVEALNGAYESVGAAEQNFATAAAEAQTGIDAALADTLNSFQDFVTGLDESEEARANAVATFDAIAEGIESASPGALEKLAAFVNDYNAILSGAGAGITLGGNTTVTNTTNNNTFNVTNRATFDYAIGKVVSLGG